MQDLSCCKLHQLPGIQATRHPRATALWWRGEAVDYGTLNDRVLQLAARLASEGSPGDRVAVLSWNCPEFIELIYAASAAGRILVPLNARLAPAELIYQLTSAQVCSLFGDTELLRPLLGHADYPDHIHAIGWQGDYDQWLASGGRATLPSTAIDDPAWILYTSGTTGRPKGAVLTHRSFMAGLRSAALGRPVVPTDRYLYPFPLFHVAAHNVLLQHQSGAAVVLTRSFDAGATLRACRELGVTTLSLAPTMIAMLFDHPDFNPGDLSCVRTIGYGASAMPVNLLQRLLADTNVGLCQSYGMTELSGSVAFLTVADHHLAASSRPELLKSVGRPLPTATVKLAGTSGEPCCTGESGEILVKARQCMQGYWRDDQTTAAAIEDGWLHTGDIGRFDEEGYLYIVDRKKDMIISGGENVASREVEEAIRSHSSVKDCAVIGLPHPQWGEMVCAVVQLGSAASDEELSDHCRALLAAYKTPKKWIRTDALPVNAGGKIDKALLRRTQFVD